MNRILVLLLVSASLCFARGHDQTNDGPPLVEPNFLLPANPDVSDYRPVLNAEGTVVIFERNPTATPDDVKLYSADLSTGDVQPFVTFASARADWCWDRSGGGITSGPVAFSNNDGIYTVADGSLPVLLPNTAGMIYPSWYPDCQHLAVDVTGTQVTAEIDAITGVIIIPRLANETVWAGFASVNQTNPNLIAFAGQFNGESNYYNQDLNYIWVTDRSTGAAESCTAGSQGAERPSVPAKISSTRRVVVTRWQMVRL